MAVIFLGATTPEADWATPTVVAIGTITGLAAGTVLGLVSGWLLPTLDGPPARDRAVMALLRSPAHGLLDGSLVVLRVRGTRSGRLFELPVQYAADADGVVVIPGLPETKRWWRNLTHPAPVAVLRSGSWLSGEGRLLSPGDAGYIPALRAYRRRWPRVRVLNDGPVIRVAGTVESSPGARTVHDRSRGFH
jgi:hypothetical protein